ncbi:MAG: hypothetical protein SFW67_30200 [Myxococcaceae bacterium]|nr:hypothetical protein [Myxococcaceae bacterium]
MRRIVTLVLTAALLVGCPKPAAGPAPESMDAAVDAGPIDAGVVAAAPLTFRLTATLVDGGLQTFDDLDAGLVLDPSRALELSASVGLVGARVRLLDWTDAVVASDDSLETSDAGFSYRIDLLQPLKSGRSYSVLVDAESAERVSDGLGREFDEWRLGVRVTGEVQPEPGQGSEKPKKTRR